MQVRDIMREVRTLLGDETSVRWPLRELRIWVNAGVREIVTLKPSAGVVNEVLSLIAGSRQKIPESAIQLVRVYRNNRSNHQADNARDGRTAITAVAREILDTQSPGWHDPAVTTPTKEAVHVVYDEFDPRVFYVYPPNNGLGRVEAAVARIPAATPSGNPINDINGYAHTLALDDGYWNALRDYVLSKAYMKDASFAGNAQRSQMHYSAFLASIGVRENTGRSGNPNSQNANEVPVNPRPAMGG